MPTKPRRAIAKDGATVPEMEGEPVPAAQIIAVGETYDFAYDAPPGLQSLWLNVRTAGGKREAQAQVIVK
jgi:hypothetical protein